MPLIQPNELMVLDLILEQVEACDHLKPLPNPGRFAQYLKQRCNLPDSIDDLSDETKDYFDRHSLLNTLNLIFQSNPGTPSKNHLLSFHAGLVHLFQIMNGASIGVGYFRGSPFTWVEKTKDRQNIQTEEAWRDVDLFTEFGVDWKNALIELADSKLLTEQLVLLVWRKGLIRPEEMVDFSRLIGLSNTWSSIVFEYPQYVEFWIKLQISAKLHYGSSLQIPSAFRSFLDHVHQMQARGHRPILEGFYEAAIRRCMHGNDPRPPMDFLRDFSKGEWGRPNPDLIPQEAFHLLLLDDLVFFMTIVEKLSLNDKGLLPLLWELGIIIRFYGNESHPDALPSKRKAAWVKTAEKELAAMRAITRRAHEEKSKEDFDLRMFEQSVRCLLWFAGVWPALKSLLLMISTLSSAGLLDDLRTWREYPKPNLPAPWGRIFEYIGFVLTERQIREERRLDPELVSLRESFAAFCLERLKTRKLQPKRTQPDDDSELVRDKSITKPIQIRNEDFVEPRPIWREAYLNALIELRASPKRQGKPYGHQVLYWVRQQDPIPELRDLARLAYKQLRHQENIPLDKSPLSALFGAFWWLRQAHVIALGGHVDARKANSTRQKEVRRSKEIL